MRRERGGVDLLQPGSSESNREYFHGAFSSFRRSRRLSMVFFYHHHHLFDDDDDGDDDASARV